MPLTIDNVFQCWQDKLKRVSCDYYYLLLTIAKQTVFSWLSHMHCWYNKCLIGLLFKISSKCLHCDSLWNVFIVYPEMHSNKWQDINLILVKYSSPEGGRQFPIFCKAANTCSMKHEKHIHNYAKLLYFATDICAKNCLLCHSVQLEKKTNLPNPSELMKKCFKAMRVSYDRFMSWVGLSLMKMS